MATRRSAGGAVGSTERYRGVVSTVRPSEGGAYYGGCPFVVQAIEPSVMACAPSKTLGGVNLGRASPPLTLFVSGSRADELTGGRGQGLLSAVGRWAQDVRAHARERGNRDSIRDERDI